MRLFHLDWSSDYAIFFMVIVVFAIITMIALDRVSPQRAKRRRVDQSGKQQISQLID